MDLELTLRHYTSDTPPDVSCDESNFFYVERRVSIPAAQSAVVLVDVWDDHYIASHLARTAEIARTRLAPTLTAAREAGVTVIHAPSPPMAHKYPQWLRYAGDTELHPPATPEPAWPPREFRRREGQYAVYKRPVGPTMTRAEQEAAKRRIDPAVEPHPDDFVIATGAQLHRLCRDRQIVHLFYGGFATNMCVPFRDYGILAFRDRGYHVILLRDCTTAIEGHDTLDDLRATWQAIRELEIRDKAFTTTSDDFIRACRAVTAATGAGTG